MTQRRARAAVYRAVRRGVLRRPNRCSECGAEGPVQGHHIDYMRPLEVVWLCRRCHRRADGLPRKPCPRCGMADRWAKVGLMWRCIRCEPPRVVIPPMPRNAFARVVRHDRETG